MFENEARIGLLGGFEFLIADHRIALSLGAQRLLAFLALQDGGAHRTTLAERLWPDSPPSRAAANLRSALWQGRRVGPVAVVESVGPRLRLSTATRVDLGEVRRRTRWVLEREGPLPETDCDTLVDRLSRELLPHWSDEWLPLERERWDQERLHTLERLAQRLRTGGQYLPALQTALAAVAIEPIRETAHRIVIEVHIAEGNVASALKHYRQYRSILQRELGVGPSPRMVQLVRALELPIGAQARQVSGRPPL